MDKSEMLTEEIGAAICSHLDEAKSLVKKGEFDSGAMGHIDRARVLLAGISTAEINFLGLKPVKEK